MTQLQIQAKAARSAWRTLAVASTEKKNEALGSMAASLKKHQAEILAANALDIEAAKQKGTSAAFIERLTLSEKRIDAMADGLRQVCELPDPIGTALDEWTRPNGLKIVKRRVPLGVIGIIYESRPNVTADAAALCLKSGNAVILRGGSDAFRSNAAIMQALREGVSAVGLPADCVSLVMDTSRETANELMRMNEYIDVLIPRGGKGLIQSVVKNATVPVIQTGDGICHVYVDGACDVALAQKVAISAKISRPSVCNSAETLLIDEAIAESFLPACVKELTEKGVEVRGCEKTLAICPEVKAATEADWDTEYNDMIYSVKVVSGVEEAVEHINAHGTRHSEAIMTESAENARYFQNMVDAAAVYVNASTRFTDGGEFGFGAEIGISTQKLHARGPMGLNELTTCKYEITGSGQIR
jgi:glutamate-5-semialdehyde dehydrogenase